MDKRWTVAAVIWMVLIFTVTQLPYFTGKNTSEAIHKVVAKEEVTFNSPNADSVDVSILNLIVRKTTHLIVFGLLASLWLKALENVRYSYLISWFITFFYAMTDEWHQSYIEGRVASFRDVGLDSLGALLFLVIVFSMNKKSNPKQIT